MCALLVNLFDLSISGAINEENVVIGFKLFLKHLN